MLWHVKPSHSLTPGSPVRKTWMLLCGLVLVSAFWLLAPCFDAIMPVWKIIALQAPRCTPLLQLIEDVQDALQSASLPADTVSRPAKGSLNGRLTPLLRNASATRTCCCPASSCSSRNCRPCRTPKKRDQGKPHDC